MTGYHKSVLTKEVIEQLKPKPNGLYIDATFGGGGHTTAILQAEPTCKVIAIDWDKVAIETNGPPIKQQFGDRIKLIWGNFAKLYLILKKEKWIKSTCRIKQVDGILADFGTSQFQIHQKEGFSFQTNTPLDMRMSPAHQRVTAEQIINSASERELTEIFFKYGEEKKSKKIAREIVAQRKIKPITTTRELAEIIEYITPRTKITAIKKIHPATKIFQALRIVVNKELENIEIFIKAAINALAPNGKIACISFHSLEDRIVKNTFKKHQDELEILTNKPITASQEEIERNPSARSAKLRVAQKRDTPQGGIIVDKS
jgi:16S rRNA (cytosine1402-N4)-methyltransferase